MNCQAYEHQIGDYVDGTIHAALRRDVEKHLAGCAACRAVAVDFAAIRALAQTLEPQVPPARVWRQIEAATPRRPLRLILFGWEPMMAAAMALIVVAGLTWVGGRLAQTVTVVPAGARAIADVPLGTERQQAEADYVNAIATLEEVTTADRDVLDPDTADVVQTGMAVIDSAIAESRAVLATNPDSAVAQDSLFEALRRKVALLQYVFALINEMRKGNEAGAARVLSELNQ